MTGFGSGNVIVEQKLKEHLDPYYPEIQLLVAVNRVKMGEILSCPMEVDGINSTLGGIICIVDVMI